MTTRTESNVFDDHLRLRMEGNVEEDIEKNYADDCALISSINKFEGKQGIIKSAKVLQQDIGNAEYFYVRKWIFRDFAYLIWKAKSPVCSVEYGVDSFLKRDGRIQIQSFFYVVERRA